MPPGMEGEMRLADVAAAAELLARGRRLIVYGARTAANRDSGRTEGLVAHSYGIARHESAN